MKTIIKQARLPQRIFVDCSYAFKNIEPRGIDRVIRQILAHASESSRRFDVEITPVAWLNDGHFHLIPGPAVPNSTSTTGPVWQAITAWITRGIIRLVVPYGLLRLITKLRQRRRDQKEADTYQIVKWQPDDILFCPDATWHLTAAYRESLKTVHQQGIKLIIFIHDLIELNTHPYINENFKRWLNEVLKITDLVLTNSQATAQELKDYSRQTKPAVKIQTTYLGSNFSQDLSTNTPIREDIANAFMAGRPYLVIGILEPRKNQDLVFRAFEQLWARGIMAKVCFIGYTSIWSNSLHQAMRSSPYWGSYVHVLEGVNDEELTFCYANSKALIAPSLKEGFDLPIVEARHYGLPVLASNIPVHKEIAKANLHYFDPRNPASLAKLIQRVETYQLQLNKNDNFRWQDWQQAVDTMIEKLLGINRG